MKNNIYLGLFFIINAMLQVSAITISENELHVARQNNYTISATGDIPFSDYSINLSSDSLFLLTKSRNGSVITASIFIPASADYKKTHAVFISTKDASGNITETAKILFKITINLTDSEIASLISDLEVLKETNEQLNSTNTKYKYDLDSLRNDSSGPTGWDQYGGTVTAVMMSICGTITFVLILAIPMYGRLSLQRRKARKERDESETQRELAERKKVISDLHMNPPVEHYNGKTKSYRDLLSVYEAKAVHDNNPGMDLSYYLTPVKEFIEEIETGHTRKRTSLDVIKDRLQEDDSIKENFLKQKHIMMAIIKNLAMRGYKNGIGAVSERDAFPIECTFDDILDFTKYVHDKKEEQLGGAKDSETKQYDKFNKDLFDDYKQVKSDMDGTSSKKDMDFRDYVKTLKRVN